MFKNTIIILLIVIVYIFRFTDGRYYGNESVDILDLHVVKTRHLYQARLSPHKKDLWLLWERQHKGKILKYQVIENGQ